MDRPFTQEQCGTKHRYTRFKTNHRKSLKILVVIDSVAREDIRNRQLLGTESGSGKVFRNILKHLLVARKLKFTDVRVESYPIKSFRGLNPQDHDRLHKQCHKRIDKVIDEYQPDRVLFMGPDVIRRFLPSRLSDVDATRLFGVVRKYRGVKATGTIALSSVANDFRQEKKFLDLWPNLIGFVVNHFDYLIYGKNPWPVDVSKYECKEIKNYKQFKKLYAKLVKAKRVAIDTEGTSLLRYSCDLLTIQFSFDGQTAWVLPWKHPESPFSAKELEKMDKKLKHYFEFGESKYHIYANAIFDITQLIIHLGLRYYTHDIYDVQAGAFSLDENRKFFRELLPLKHDELKKFPGYALDQLVMERGCFIFHGDLPVGKADRHRLKDCKLKDVCVYGGYDAVVTYQLHDCQLAEAKHRGKQYNRFCKVVVNQIGAMIHEFIQMEMNGLPVDQGYLLRQMKPNSKINKHIREIEEKLKKRKSAQKAMKCIKKQKGIPQEELFGAKGDDKMFKISSREFQQALFFDVLGLKPLDDRKDGKGAKIDQRFQNTYRHVKEVALFEKYKKASVLQNSFIKGFYKKLTENPDSRYTGCMHPNFLYFTIITGRSGAQKPSLQQVPSRGELSSIIKRMFVPSEGDILIKLDYAAHEVRNWALAAADDILAAAFQVGLDKRRAYRLLKNIDDEVRAKWAPIFKASDVHRVNYSHFFGVKPTEVNPEQRQSVKEVVFGVIYGKTPPSLARTLKISEQKARELIDMLFARFKRGAAFIEKTIQGARKNLYIIGPQGRVRHLWGYLHWHRAVHGNMDRRGPNSSIQGVSSDEGFVGGRELQRMIWENFVQYDQPFSLRTRNKVHDSSENTVNLIELPVALYCIEAAYIDKVRDSYFEIFNFEFNVDLAIDVGMGGSLANITEWDWSKQHLLQISEDSIKWMKKELGYSLNTKKLMRDIEHNATIVDKIRRKELKKGVTRKKLLINPENALDLGLRFSQPRG